MDNKNFVILLVAIIFSILLGIVINSAEQNYKNKKGIPIVQNLKKEENHSDSEKNNAKIEKSIETAPNTTPDTTLDIVHNTNKKYYLVGYHSLKQWQCEEYKERLGLKYCPYDNDHLAGAAYACGHINNLPSAKDLQELAKQIYNTQSQETSIYGKRNDSQLKEMGIFVNDSHIYYWIGEEAKDGVGGYVRMFASRGSIPYYAPRDGSGYVSHALGKIDYGDTKNISTRNPEHDSNLAGLPNNDVLVTICYK